MMSNPKIVRANKNKSLVLPTAFGLTVIPCNNIIRCRAKKNSSLIYLVDGEIKVIKQNLSFFQSKLEEWNFIRLDKSQLVNLNYTINLSTSKSVSNAAPKSDHKSASKKIKNTHNNRCSI